MFKRLRGLGILMAAVATAVTLFSYQTASAQAPPPPAANQTSVKTCENLSLSDLSWIGCSLVRGIDGVLNALTTEVRQLLEINPDYYEDKGGPGGSNRIKEAWGNINQLATAGLLIAGLVMVISTALGFSLVDAYTLKKVLPRIVIAAIGMQLSWYLMAFAIAFTNDVGKGIADLMYAPFGGVGSVDLATDLSSAARGGESGWLNAAAIGGLGVAWLFGIISLGATAMLAILVGFIILLIRRMVIIALMVFAPMAIVSSILPNTDGLWKFWRGAFSKLLLMYPFVMILIAGGKIFARLTALNGADGVFENIGQFGAVMIGYFAPFAGIPFAFRYVGGFAAQLGGLVNDRSRGMFDRQKRKRAETFKNRWARASTDRIFSKATQGKQFFDRDAEGNRMTGWKNFHAIRGARGMAARRITGAYDIASNSPWANAKLRGGKRAQQLLGYSLGKKRDAEIAGVNANANMSADEKAAEIRKINAKYNDPNSEAYGRAQRALRGVAGASADIRGSIDRASWEQAQKVSSMADNLGINDRALRASAIAGDDMGALRDAALKLSQSDDINDQIGATQITDTVIPFVKKIHESDDYGRANLRAAFGLSYAKQGFAQGGEINAFADKIGESSPGVAQAFRTQAELASRRGGEVSVKPGSSVVATYDAVTGKTKWETITDNWVYDNEGRIQYEDDGKTKKRRFTDENSPEFKKVARAQAALALRTSPGEVASSKTLAGLEEGYKYILTTDDRDEKTGNALYSKAQKVQVAKLLANQADRFGSANPNVRKEIEGILSVASTVSDEDIRAAAKIGGLSAHEAEHGGAHLQHEMMHDAGADHGPEPGAEPPH